MMSSGKLGKEKKKEKRKTDKSYVAQRALQTLLHRHTSKDSVHY